MALVVSDITTACNEHLSKSTLTEFQNHPALFTVRRIAICKIADGQGYQNAPDLADNLAVSWQSELFFKEFI